MKLTCHIVPTAARTVYFDEAASLYSWTIYEVEVIADAFRDYTGTQAQLSLSYGGTVYATATLAYDPTRRDRRVGTLTLVNDSFTTLYNLLKVSAGTDQARYTANFAFTVQMSGDGYAVANTTVPVVVMPYVNSGYAGEGGTATGTIDDALDSTSARAVQNSVIANKFEQVTANVTAATTAASAAQTAVTNLATTVTNHTASTEVHVTAADKTKWNGAVYVTDAQKTALQALLNAPLTGESSFDTIWGRVNALTSFVANLLGVTST